MNKIHVILIIFLISILLTNIAYAEISIMNEQDFKENFIEKPTIIYYDKDNKFGIEISSIGKLKEVKKEIKLCRKILKYVVDCNYNCICI